jgi:hypothetical protein
MKTLVPQAAKEEESRRLAVVRRLKENSDELLTKANAKLEATSKKMKRLETALDKEKVR